MDLEHYKDVLSRAGVTFEQGLSSQEIQRIEEEYAFRFPPDLKAFLKFALPISHGFVNWRTDDEDSIVKSLLWPYIGICFDIAHNSFWLKEWGERPASVEDAYAIARKAVDDAPTLIPINFHRYIPDRPRKSGNPVFSVFQTDIIYYGANLGDHIENEFSFHFGRSDTNPTGEIREIEFWSQFAENRMEHSL